MEFPLSGQRQGNRRWLLIGTLSIFIVRLIFLVNIKSLQENHDEHVFEHFNHLSPSILDTCLSLPFPKESS